MTTFFHILTLLLNIIFDTYSIEQKLLFNEISSFILNILNIVIVLFQIMFKIRKKYKSKIGWKLEYLFNKTTEESIKCIICEKLKNTYFSTLCNNCHKKICKNFFDNEKRELLQS